MQPILASLTTAPSDGGSTASASRSGNTSTAAGTGGYASDFDALVAEKARANQDPAGSPPADAATDSAGETSRTDPPSDGGTLMAGLMQAMGLTMVQPQPIPAAATGTAMVSGVQTGTGQPVRIKPQLAQGAPQPVTGTDAALDGAGSQAADGAALPTAQAGTPAGTAVGPAQTDATAMAGQTATDGGAVTAAQQGAQQVAGQGTAVAATVTPVPAAVAPRAQPEASPATNPAGRGDAIEAPAAAGRAATAKPAARAAALLAGAEEKAAGPVADPAKTAPADGLPPAPDAGLLPLTPGQTAAREAGHVPAATRAGALAHSSPANQVMARIEQAVSDGQTTLTVRLDPESLGRVEVRLDVQDGRVTALISADRQSTLDLLQRDQRLLERAVSQSGLQLQSDGLQFSLRDGGGQWAGTPSGGRAARVYGVAVEADAAPDLLTPAPVRSDSLVDIQI
ncbi:flagellar hook-length control protein FliK [Oleisolibacter albus]|uniref:flagellar hook-length control protein FliK n=1 Tax=Oleisolibacter albus TaxID=2171757 RepID=UPI000DF290E3|nr:flagellar hook-length control protein FliK [Oleisolibacter albus]